MLYPKLAAGTGDLDGAHEQKCGFALESAAHSVGHPAFQFSEGACITRKYLPKKVIETKLSKGEFVAQENDDGTTVLKWKDKRNVSTLSPKHTDKFTRVKVKGKDVQKQAMVIRYNKCKASVDMNDQMIVY
ncbi:hypothetical protein EVAR_43117_1 [Eumeta japonica]|uniref:PiggyBac transposable element-derived protein domain-containing protein n=1 Tax=Eumeta variegata TaxID=151549 RepID=A0A4C1YJ20_EUMVA|nr:hypothetical protein EVAR_43117_1 [Eumeta japonica]